MVAKPMDAFDEYGSAFGAAPAEAAEAPALLAPVARHPEDARLVKAMGQWRGLTEAIEAAIVPRLVLAHPRRPTEPAAPAGAAATLPGIDDFVALLLSDDDGAAAIGAVLALHGGGAGVPLDTIHLALLAPAARRLGEMWEEDSCDFATVTIGLHHLHAALRAFRDACLGGEEAPAPIARRAVLLAAPDGEQHVFGLAMVGEFLRRAGWEVRDAIGLRQGDLAALARREWFTIAAFTLSAESRLSPLAALVRAVRGQACNPAIGILVGGRVFADRPDQVARVGADATAGDARQAVLQAERLWAAAAAEARPAAAAPRRIGAGSMAAGAMAAGPMPQAPLG